MTEPTFSERGSSGLHPDWWIKWLGKFKDKPCVGLELGCFEGKSSLWFLENILTHAQSKLHVIDTFEGGPDFTLDGGPLPDFTHMREMFEHNVEPYKEKVVIHQGLSSLELLKLNFDIDWIYVDASHQAHDVLFDSVVSWSHLKSNGIMFWDDYLLTVHEGPDHSPKRGVDAFLHCHVGHFEQLFPNGWQVAVKKL